MKKNLITARLQAIRCVLLLSVFACTSIAAKTSNVSSELELANALAAAEGGDTIRLAPGDYGQLRIDDLRFGSELTIISANASSPAVFSNINITNCENIRIESVRVLIQAREGFGVFGNSRDITIVNSSASGSNQFDRSAPNYTQVSTLYGLHVDGDPIASNITVENVSITDVKSSAYLFTNIADSTIRENRCDWVASDCFKLAQADGILFENNFGAQNVHGSPSSHIDFVQGQGDVSNSVFRGNVALMGSRSFQGLFFDDAVYTNLTFENNLIHNANIRGISVSEGSGIVARYNTVLTVADPGEDSGRYHRAALILLPSGSVNERNIVANITTKNERRFEDNVIAQWDDEDDVAHYLDYFVNGMVETFAKVSDFAPVKGSLADGQFGAFARINELLSTPNTPAAVNMMPVQMLLLEED